MTQQRLSSVITILSLAAVVLLLGEKIVGKGNALFVHGGSEGIYSVPGLNELSLETPLFDSKKSHSGGSWSFLISHQLPFMQLFSRLTTGKQSEARLTEVKELCAAHQILRSSESASKIRRYAYQDVVRLGGADKLMDCAHLQTKSTNCLNHCLNLLKPLKKDTELRDLLGEKIMVTIKGVREV